MKYNKGRKNTINLEKKTKTLKIKAKNFIK